MYKEINIPKEKQNKWEHLFEELLSVVDFKLVRYGRGYYGLSDNQGANLGGIEQCVFKTAEQIIDRLDAYIHDSIINDLDEELDTYHIQCPLNDVLLKGDSRLEYTDCDYFRILLEWLQENSEEGKEFVENHRYDYDCLELITKYFEEVDLQNISALITDRKVRIVAVTETYSKCFMVVAESQEEAKEIVGEAWNDGSLGDFDGSNYVPDSYLCDDITEEYGDWPSDDLELVRPED